MKKRLIGLGCLAMTAALLSGCGVAPNSGDMGYYPMEDGIFESDDENYVYDEVIEQGFVDTAQTPSSYFSLDRNTAGYSLVRAQVREGLQIDPDSVRLEELVNYFDYAYPAPKAGEAVGISAYLSDCPWNDAHSLLTLGLRTEEAVRTGSANYVLLIDVSGSMGSTVWGTEGQSCLDLVKYGANKLVDTLGEGDRLSIVTYASGVSTVLESTEATAENKPAIRNAIDRLNAYGSTNGSGGLDRAYEQAEAFRTEDGNNRIILLSDGDFNVGISDEDELTEFIQEKAKSGIALSVAAVGMGNMRDDFMQTLALNGNGNYAYIDTPLEAEKVFTKEVAGTLYTVAHDAKAGITFDADTVSSYRLLGYDMKTMSEDDFNNADTDAGEIGSNLCVTAMYEIVRTDADTDASLAEVAVRYRNTAGEDDEVTLTVTGEEQATQDTAFAACVAEFALVLRQSQYRGNASLGDVLVRLEDLRDLLLADAYKAEFAELVAVALQSGFYDYGPAELPETGPDASDGTPDDAQGSEQTSDESDGAQGNVGARAERGAWIQELLAFVF